MTGDPPEDAALGRSGALRIPLYRRFWQTLLVSLTGTWARLTAIGYLTYELTDSELSLGWISLAASAPVLITSPIAGILLDRVDRARVLFAIQLVNLIATLTVAGLVATGRVTFWHLFVMSLVFGLSIGIDYPARFSIVASIVPKPALQSAIALNQVAYNGSSILGPAAAGWLISGIGVTACFIFSTGAIVPFVIVAASIAFRATRDRAAPAAPRSSGFSELIAGYRYILADRQLRGLFAVSIPVLMLGVSYVTMAPAVARDVLGLDSRGLGLLLTANGAGALIGSYLIATNHSLRRRGPWNLFGVAVFGLALMGFALSTNAWVSGLFVVGLGIANALYGVLNGALVQLATSDEYRGRVTSAYSTIWALTPIGGLQVGFLAGHIGLQSALFLNGALVLLCAGLLWFKSSVRTID